MKNLMNELERCSTLPGGGALSSVQLKASLAAATDFMRRWNHEAMFQVDSSANAPRRIQCLTVRQASRAGQPI